MNIAIQNIPKFLNNFENLKIINRQLAIGKDKSGSPPHYHSYAWNILLYGKKEWLFLSPSLATVANIHNRNWFDLNLNYYYNNNNNNNFIYCLQQAGDFVFVPSHWTHLTRSVYQSIGLAYGNYLYIIIIIE
jgi:hypothetical protein